MAGARVCNLAARQAACRWHRALVHGENRRGLAKAPSQQPTRLGSTVVSGFRTQTGDLDSKHGRARA